MICCSPRRLEPANVFLKMDGLIEDSSVVFNTEQLSRELYFLFADTNARITL